MLRVLLSQNNNIELIRVILILSKDSIKYKELSFLFYHIITIDTCLYNHYVDLYTYYDL